MSAPAIIKGITIQQPWAWAIAVGNKPVENRTWQPPQKMLGQYLAIHAGKELDAEARAWIARVCGVNAPPDEQLRRGAIIAVAKLARTTTIANDAETLRGSTSRWATGPVCWWLEDVLPVEPIACRGQQGLWDLEPETLQALRVEWRAAAMAKAAGYKSGPVSGELRAPSAASARTASGNPSAPSGYKTPAGPVDDAADRPAENPCRCARGPRALSKCADCSTWYCDSPGHPRHTCARAA